MMQLGLYIDQNRCMGCFACVVACKDWHDVPAGRLKTIEKGKFPDLFVAFLPTTCGHCRDPECVSVCPAEAITKRDEDGIVVVDGDACLGKEACGMWPGCLSVRCAAVRGRGKRQDAEMRPVPRPMG
jgi:anaerobic dimethyl sulfoxide reductase subunit B (iron-sulfur subunit)